MNNPDFESIDMNPWASSDGSYSTDSANAAPRKWYRVGFSIYLTDDQASNVRFNFEHLIAAMSKDFQGMEPVSPAYYIDTELAEEVQPKRHWWHRCRVLLGATK